MECLNKLVDKVHLLLYSCCYKEGKEHMKILPHVEQIRSFNRFYTDVIGLLNQHLLNIHYSLAEARIIYEVYQAKTTTASEIMLSMHIDKSYLSRLLKKLERAGIIIKVPSQEDARAFLLSLSGKGKREFLQLNEESNRQIQNLIQNLSLNQQNELAKCMQTIMNILK